MVIAMAVRGEEGARALYRAYGDELYRFALTRLKDPALAEEVVQDTFLRAWRHQDRFDPKRASQRTWLFEIARNLTTDAFRRRSVRPAAVTNGATSPEAEEPGDPYSEAVDRWQIEAALVGLRPEHREVIQLVHFEGLSLEEAARRANIPVGTVKSRCFYALRSLRDILAEAGVTP
jgi:RNA polymerase sigma-70 factor, ECF subfamily